MNILITGGAGFLARHLAAYLKNQHFIYCLDKEELDCLDKSLVDCFFDRHEIDIVIHTALTGREDLFSTDSKYLVDSLVMWNNLYSNRHKYSQLIQFGSAYELDLSIKNSHIDLTDIKQVLPKYSYGYAKNIIARICADTENFYTLRLFGNFHYSEKDIRFFKKLYLSDKFIINENKIFDYFNLSDVSKVVNFVVNERPKDRDINLVYKNKYTIEEQAQMFCEINKISPEIVIKTQGPELTGNSKILDSFEIKLDGLEEGFSNYKNLL